MSKLERLKEIAAYELSKINPAPVWDEEELDEDAPPQTKAAARMRRKRKREANAVWFWEHRLRTGASCVTMINDALKNAPAIVETARKKVCARLNDLAEAYPDRTKLDVTE